MKLGFIRPYEQGAPRKICPALQSQFRLADSLGFDLAYFAGPQPKDLTRPITGRPTQIKIGLDAMGFGTTNPSEIEQAVRQMQDHFGPRLSLGLNMYGAGASSSQLMRAQAFDTLFSRDPRPESTIGTQRYPLRPPCPDIIGLPVKGTSEDVAIAAARGYCPLTPSWLAMSQAARHWPAIIQGATSALRRARRSHWHLARMIVIHDDAAILDAYVYGPNSPFRRYCAGLSACGLIGQNVDAHLKRVVIAGSGVKVADKIIELRETAGAFGTLHLITPAGSDPEMTRSTMIQLAEQVGPKVATTSHETSKELETP